MELTVAVLAVMLAMLILNVIDNWDADLMMNAALTQPVLMEDASLRVNVENTPFVKLTIIKRLANVHQAILEIQEYPVHHQQILACQIRVVRMLYASWIVEIQFAIVRRD